MFLINSDSKTKISFLILLRDRFSVMCLIFFFTGVITKTRANIEDDEENIGEAPSTITNREQLERGTADNYLYMPGLGEVPEIDVPVYLPDLPGVVDDISYRFEVILSPVIVELIFSVKLKKNWLGIYPNVVSKQECNGKVYCVFFCNNVVYSPLLSYVFSKKMGASIRPTLLSM